MLTAIHPANATEHHLVLKRISPEFVAAVREYRANRKERVQPQEYGEHFRPGRSSPRREEGDDEFMERS